MHSKRAQIFITTHSPAFTSLKGTNTVSYRVYMENGATEITQLHPLIIDSVREQLSEDIGLFRIQTELYQEYQERKAEWEKTHTEVESLRLDLLTATKPVLYVEGKLDVAVLEIAWSKLFPEMTIPFSIKSCNPLPEDDETDAGGCETLTRLLSVIPSDNPHLVVGIFDYDRAGINAYTKLPNYFDELPELDSAKLSRNNKAIGMLLPVPPERAEYAEYKNLPLEFFFGEATLSLQNSDGRGLILQQTETITRDMFTGEEVSRQASELPHSRQIISGKTVFAEDIVPSLNAGEFELFRYFFDKINAAFGFLQNRN